MPIALNSPIVGDWKSLRSNMGGTGPDPILGTSVEGVMGWREGDSLVAGVGVMGCMEGDSLVAGVGVMGWREGDSLVAGEGVMGSWNTERELEPGDDAQESSLVAEEVVAACLAFVLAAAFACQPHEHGLFVDV